MSCGVDTTPGTPFDAMSQKPGLTRMTSLRGNALLFSTIFPNYFSPSSTDRFDWPTKTQRNTSLKSQKHTEQKHEVVKLDAQNSITFGDRAFYYP